MVIQFFQQLHLLVVEVVEALIVHQLQEILETGGSGGGSAGRILDTGTAGTGNTPPVVLLKVILVEDSVKGT